MKEGRERILAHVIVLCTLQGCSFISLTHLFKVFSFRDKKEEVKQREVPLGEKCLSFSGKNNHPINPHSERSEADKRKQLFHAVHDAVVPMIWMALKGDLAYMYGGRNGC